MKIRLRWCAALLALAAPLAASATIFGVVKGIVHDPQHRPIAGATVTVQSPTTGYRSTWRDQFTRRTVC